jgi:hypothetical protein
VRTSVLAGFGVLSIAGLGACSSEDSVDRARPTSGTSHIVGAASLDGITIDVRRDPG